MDQIDIQKLKGPLKDENIQVFGTKLIIENNVMDSFITVDSDIEIYGNVSNTEIRNNGGNLFIVGDIHNSNISVFGDIYAHSAEKSKITSTYGACYISDFSYDSDISAMSLISITEKRGEILNSSLSCSIEILSNMVGKFQDNQSSCLELKPRQKQDLFELFFIYKQKLMIKENILNTLSRYIKVFSLIRDKIHDLPENKKNELIKKVKEYKQLKEDIDKIKMEKDRMFLKNPEQDKYNRSVLIKKTIYPPAKIIIDGQELELKTPEKQVGFYKSGIIIRGELENIYTKRKTYQTMSYV